MLRFSRAHLGSRREDDRRVEGGTVSSKRKARRGRRAQLLVWLGTLCSSRSREIRRRPLTWGNKAPFSSKMAPMMVKRLFRKEWIDLSHSWNSASALTPSCSQVSVQGYHTGACDLNRYWLSVCHTPRTTLGAEVTAVTQINKHLCPQEAHICTSCCSTTNEEGARKTQY